MITLSMLQAKEIVSIATGERMGNVIDLEIDVEKGLILEIIIANRSGLSGIFQKQGESIIPWSHIVTFGNDVILVK
ncbi:YlmC/YmxH family sporulation protein [Amphibacillus marinus]|nr:YlmC/YmxH family sporulation protein [Amphibacillus marinus]